MFDTHMHGKKVRVGEGEFNTSATAPIELLRPLDLRCIKLLSRFEINCLWSIEF